MTTYDSVIIEAIEARTINLNFIFWSKAAQRWEVYAKNESKVQGAPAREWIIAPTFRAAVQQLLGESTKHDHAPLIAATP